MLIESAWILAAFSSVQVFSLWIIGMGVAFLTLVSLAGILVPAWVNVHKVRLETSLKKQMIERGMPAEEILKVLNGRRQDPSGVVDYPCASEVVVESEGEWSPSFILKRDGERYLIHYVGTEMSDNEWVTSDRVRFPARTQAASGSPWDWSSAGAFDASRWCAKNSKPAPVDGEL